MPVQKAHVNLSCLDLPVQSLHEVQLATCVWQSECTSPRADWHSVSEKHYGWSVPEILILLAT